MNQRVITDAEALPLLIEVMRAAGAADGPECLRLLSAAEETLTPGRPGAFHKSRSDIHAAAAAVGHGEWARVWQFAWSATTGLTFAFPPDPSVCPPSPGTATVEGACRACGATVSAAHRFCHGCGKLLAVD